MRELSHEELLFILNGLIETCLDGRNGFLDAEHLAQNARLKRLCAELAHQRAEFAASLRDEARHLGGEPNEAGSVPGGLHRRWIAVKAAVAGQDDLAILSECLRGEDLALARYREALDKKLPAPIRELAFAQSQKVDQAKARLRELRA